MDYSTWQTVTEKTANLFLDSQNPRIPNGVVGGSQQELIAELLEHDHVMELAKQIADRGFFPTEVMAVVEEEGRRVVVEGNRRLTALKVLAEPELAPEKFQKRLRVLASKTRRDQLSRVQICVAPNRESVVPLLLGRHTQQSINQWDPAVQARFVVSLQAAGATAEDLAVTYGLTESDLNEAVFHNALYTMATSLELPADVKAIVSDPRSFPLSNLERVVEMKEGQQFLGITIDKEVGIRGRIPKGEFTKGFSRLVQDVATGKVHSRTHNKSEELRTYFEGLPAADRPSHDVAGEFVPADFTKPVEAPATRSPMPRKPTRSAKESLSILDLDLKCAIHDRRIQDVFKELKKLKLKDFPNASALLYRTMLELVASHFLRKHQQIAVIKRQVEKAQKSKLPESYHPELRSMLNHIVLSCSLPFDPPQVKSLTAAIKGKGNPLTLDQLNGFVHSSYEVPTDRELRAIAQKLKPLMQILLADK